MRKALELINGVMVFAMFVVLTIQIAGRVIFALPTTWSSEMSIILFALIVMYGLPAITLERTHLRVDSLYMLMPKKVQIFFEFICGFVYIAFFGYLAHGAYYNAIDNWVVEIPTIEWLHLGWVYLLICVATSLHIVALCQVIYEDGKLLWGRKDKC